MAAPGFNPDFGGSGTYNPAPTQAGTGGLSLGDVFDFAVEYGGDILDFLGWGEQPGTGVTTNGNRLPAQDGMGNVVNGGGMTAPATGCAVVMAPQYQQRVVCPPGYVSVRDPQTGGKVCMLKEVAKSCGLWRPRPKPLLTASDRRTLSKASSVMRRVDNVVKRTNRLRGGARLVKKTRR